MRMSLLSISDSTDVEWSFDILKSIIKIFDVCCSIPGNHKNQKTDSVASITLYRDNYDHNIHCKYDIMVNPL